MNKTLLTAAVSPDLDGVSCAIAYADYLRQKDSEREYVAAFEGQPVMEPQFVCEQLGITVRAIEQNDEFDEIIILDASEKTGLPKIIAFDKVVEVIDHRMFADFAAFPNAQFRVEPVGAAATQIAEFFYFDQGVPLSPENASLLLGGIYSNTVNFQSDTTTFRDMRMRDWLVTKVKPEHRDLSIEMFKYKSQYALDNLSESLRLDAKPDCDQFGFDEPVAVFQIETILAPELLERQAETLDVMAELFPNRRRQLLLIQDAANGQTLLISNSPDILNALRSSTLRIEPTESSERLKIDAVTMRKSVLKAALDHAKLKG